MYAVVIICVAVSFLLAYVYHSLEQSERTWYGADDEGADMDTAQPTFGAFCPECGERDGHKNGCTFKPVKIGGR